MRLPFMHAVMSLSYENCIYIGHQTSLTAWNRSHIKSSNEQRVELKIEDCGLVRAVLDLHCLPGLSSTHLNPCLPFRYWLGRTGTLSCTTASRHTGVLRWVSWWRWIRRGLAWIFLSSSSTASLLFPSRAGAKREVAPNCQSQIWGRTSHPLLFTQLSLRASQTLFEVAFFIFLCGWFSCWPSFK